MSRERGWERWYGTLALGIVRAAAVGFVGEAVLRARLAGRDASDDDIGCAGERVVGGVREMRDEARDLVSARQLWQRARLTQRQSQASQSDFGGASTSAGPCAKRGKISRSVTERAFFRRQVLGRFPLVTSARRRRMGERPRWWANGDARH